MVNFVVKNIIKHLALKRGKFLGIYIRWCKPNSEEFNYFLKRCYGVHSIGSETHINRDVKFTDPAYVRIGNNCILSTCTLIGHDASVGVLNHIYGKRLDSVGKIDIKDNCFIGMGVIVMPDVTIGPNSIVAAGAVVTKDVLPGTIVGGVPAKVIGNTDALVQKLDVRTKSYPWAHLIENRVGAFDANIEAELVKMRVKHFFN
jgi:acetyltransferase-like isoleucine patch superfamily enzyme